MELNVHNMLYSLYAKVYSLNVAVQLLSRG